MPSIFDNVQIDEKSQSYLDLLGLDKWTNFTPVFGSLTVVGATTYTGRFRISGASVEVQVSFLAATSITSIAGTDYFTLPIAAKGLSGFGVMTNNTTNAAVGLCHLDVTTGRCYLPAQAASGDTFTLFLSYEI